jgi:ACS family tartrate transporter-like MFS transporter
MISDGSPEVPGAISGKVEPMKASLELVTMQKVAWHLVLFLCVLYAIAFIIRTNVGFTSIIMGDDLGLTSEMLGWGAGLFFISYLFFRCARQSDAAPLRRKTRWCRSRSVPRPIVAITRWFAKQWRGRVTAAFVAAIPISSQRIASDRTTSRRDPDRPVAPIRGNHRP